MSGGSPGGLDVPAARSAFGVTSPVMSPVTALERVPEKDGMDEHAGEVAAAKEEGGRGRAPLHPTAKPSPCDAADTLQDPREAAPPRPPVPSARSRSHRDLEPNGSRELEMQELPPSERNRDGHVGGAVLGHDSTSRLRKLHSELERIVHRHDQEKASVQSWGTWLWELCTLGNILQAACAGIMFFSLFLSGGRYETNLVVALILCGSLLLLLWVQHVSFKRRGMLLGSRARRALAQLEWYIKNPLESSTFSSPVSSGANVWVQTSRPISAVQVSSDSGPVVLPTQLLVSGDQVVGPTDHWLVDHYCDAREMSDAVVRDTPSATQLSKVLSQPRRPLSQLDVQMNIVNTVVQWAVVCALVLSLLSSAILVVMYPEMSTRDTLHLAIVRHVPVCLPLLPISIFLSSAVVHMSCNAYLAAKVQYKYNLRAGTALDSGILPQSAAEEPSANSRKPDMSKFWRWIALLRARTGLGVGGVTGAESDQAPMINGDGDADRLQHARKASSKLDWACVWDHIIQRLKVPRPDQDRAIAAGIINPCADLVDALGSATVLCFSDVDGIVCEPVMSPKQILLLSPDHKSGDSTAGASVSVIELLGAEKGAPCGACTFQDAGAVDEHLSLLKPLGLNCLLNTNAHSDAYTTFVECTLRQMVHQRQEEGGGAAGNIARALAGGGGGMLGGGRSGVGAASWKCGDWVRSDAYVDMVSCDSCDSSYLLAPVIGFSSSAGASFNRLLELQILVRHCSSKVRQQHRRGSSAGGTPGGLGSHMHMPASAGGPSGASPAASSYLIGQRPDALRAGDDAAAAAAFGAATGSGSFLPARSVAGSDGGGEVKSGNRTQSPHMMAVVVEDADKQLQVFAKGDVESVLEQCNLVWDGEELRPMRAEDIKCILTHCSECYQKHYRCVAYSYVSLGVEKRELIKSCSQLGRSVFLEKDASGGLSMFGASDWEPPAGADEPAMSGSFPWRRPKTQPSKTLSSISEELLVDHVFIGMLTMRHRPYTEITETMDTLSEAGIRFVFFSEMQEPPTVAFGNQLGLWSDWNCCISLRDLPPPPRSHPPSPPGSGISGRSHVNRNANYSHASGPRLPHGIRAIRRHIEEADDVPLRVSMFCDSSPETITSMVGILQEHGECVVACGSSRNAHNMPLFATADLAVSATPLPPVREHGEGARLGWGGLHAELPESITSVPCALNVNRRFNMEELIEFISTSRTLLDAVRQASQYGLGISLLLMLLALLCNLLMIPQVVEPAQALCHLVLIAPCFLFAIVVSTQRISARVKSASPMRMKLLRGYNNTSLSKRPEMRRRALYLIIRILPTTGMLLGVFVDSLSISLMRYKEQVLREQAGKSAAPGGAAAAVVGEGMASFCYRDQWSLVDLIKLSSYAESRYLDMEPCPDNAARCCFDLFQLALVEARQLTNILVVIMMAVLCIGSLHRTSSILDIWRHCKYIWLLAVLAAAAIQVLVTTISMQTSFGGLRPTLHHVPPSVIALATIWPIVVFAVDVAIRHHDRNKVRRLQQRLTLEFETLLGQTSPK